MPEFSERSKKNLSECDKRLQQIMNEVIQHYDISIICGYRGQEAQDKAYNDGYSQLKFPESQHNNYPSLAVDVLPFPSKWSNEKEFYFMAGYIQSVADRLGIKINLGCRWKTFLDLPHVEIKG